MSTPLQEERSGFSGNSYFDYLNLKSVVGTSIKKPLTRRRKMEIELKKRRKKERE